MTSFETYLVQHKIKNLQPGDKVMYIGGNRSIKHNPSCTFLEFKVISGQVYIKVKEHNNILVPLRDIIKI